MNDWTTMIFNTQITLGPAYNEFGYNEHWAVMNRFFCIKIIDGNVKKFGYNEHLLLANFPIYYYYYNQNTLSPAYKADFFA